VILVVAGEVKESWGASRLGGILVAPIAPYGQVHVMGLSHHSAPVEATRFSMWFGLELFHVISRAAWKIGFLWRFCLDQVRQKLAVAEAKWNEYAQEAALMGLWIRSHNCHKSPLVRLVSSRGLLFGAFWCWNFKNSAGFDAGPGEFCSDLQRICCSRGLIYSVAGGFDRWDSSDEGSLRLVFRCKMTCQLPIHAIQWFNKWSFKATNREELLVSFRTAPVKNDVALADTLRFPSLLSADWSLDGVNKNRRFCDWLCIAVRDSDAIQETLRN